LTSSSKAISQISLQEAHLSRLSNGCANALVPRARNLPSAGRLIPKSFRWLTKTVDLFLLTHEIVENALLNELRLHYLHAHQIAVRAERDAVNAAGVPWLIYQRFMKRYERPIEEERIVRVPHNLDLTSYWDQKDFSLLRRLVRKEQAA
jgi:hypothetical protein